MKTVIALLIGLMATGVAAAYSDFALTSPTAMYSYIFVSSELTPLHMVLAGVALILFVSFREHQELIDRKRH